MKRVLVLGGGGFIGSHLVSRLKSEGCWVKAVDRRHPIYVSSPADQFQLGDLRENSFCHSIWDREFDEVYQCAAEMGGAGYVFSGRNDAWILHNSAKINLNVLECGTKKRPGRIFYPSSACVYPDKNFENKDLIFSNESSAYPAYPGSEYGWEKLFSERLYLAFQKNENIPVRIARFQNIFGPHAPFKGGREKSLAALCRKVILAPNNGEIEVWGDGKQCRSYLFIDTCIEGILQFTRSSFTGPVNMGSSEMISIEDLVQSIIKVSGKKLNIRYVPGPTGVNYRMSDNSLLKDKIGWVPKENLFDGLKTTYQWIKQNL